MSSLFAALTTAVSGLSAQSSAIGNISDNLANAQTTGYKAVGTAFSELVNASSATQNNPGGVSAVPSYQNDVQGSVTGTTTGTNIAISGQGYMQVETASTNAAGVTGFTGQSYYTRQGDFTLNNSGYLVNSSGYYLTGNVVTNGVADTSTEQPIQLSALLNAPVASSTLTYAANLPSNAAVGFTSPSSTVAIYDGLGTVHNVSYTWTKTATNAWNLVVASPSDATAGGTPYPITIPVTFSSTSPVGTISAITGGTGYTVPAAQTTGKSASISLAMTFAGQTTPQNLSLDLGAFLTGSGVTQYSDASGAVSVSNFTQNGLPPGSFNNLSINKDGLVSINYSNGTNTAIFQIPVVQFNAPDQLQRVSGGSYSSTLASGAPRPTTPGLNGAGIFAPSSIEASNVDIATQFTSLIQAQQVYSANAKVITADNQLLQTTISMVQ